ncbi:MAG: CcdB family protein [Magnetospirillum gryphiswaldense]|nr:CcdB family protein [Magnetospirillum gryphiswaldense]
MAQFDVYANPVMGMEGGAPFVVDVQSDQLDGLPTRMIVPLAIPADFQPLRHLNPLVEINGEHLALMTQFMAALPRHILGQPLTNLADRRDDIVAALDFLFTGI